VDHWYAAAELAGAPGMPGSERRTRDRLHELKLPSRPRKGREGGGGLEYFCGALDQDLLAYAASKRPHSAVTAESERVPARTHSPAEQALTSSLLGSPLTRAPSDADREVADARLLLIHAVQDLATVHGMRRSCELLAARLATKEATPELLAAAASANRRARSLFVSVRSLFRWLGLYEASG
jgi:putative transposase